MNTVIPVEDGDVIHAVRVFLKQILETGSVEALMVPLETDEGTVIPALVTDPSLLDRANPLAPVMPINGARAVSALTGKNPPSRLGVVLRPCEIRALIELVKLQQASLDNLTIIGLDCPGTYEMVAYVESQRNGQIDLAAYLEAAEAGQEPELDGMQLRPACQICTQPVPELVDVHLHMFGAALGQAIPVTIKDEFAARLDLAEALPAEEDVGREIVEKLVARRSQARQEQIVAMRNQLASPHGFVDLFAACIRCHNCMTACPICYCKTCLFKTASFDHEPEYFLPAARRKGALRLLGDTLLFHLTRLNHMSASCVGCGMCTSACPADIPVGSIFTAIGTQVQAAFDYQPGQDINQPLPLITFQVDEWASVGKET